MAITNYRIDKIEGKVEKRTSPTVDVKESFSIGEIVKKAKTLEISWGFDVDYKTMGRLSMSGGLTYFDSNIDDKYDEKTVKGKKIVVLKGTALSEVSNFVLRRGIIEAVVLTKTLQLPAPIQLPSVKVQKKE
jgi:hypothetical protein